MYWLDGGLIYPDEIFNARGFMPLLGRMAERKIRRVFHGQHIDCGFSYVPDRAGIFTECFMESSDAEGLASFHVRLTALQAVAREMIGMGYPGRVDITQVFDFFRGLSNDARSNLQKLNEKELPKWPLYQPIH